MQLPGVFFVDLAGDDEDGVLDCEEVLEVHHGLVHLRGLGHLVTKQYRTGVKNQLYVQCTVKVHRTGYIMYSRV